MHHMIRLLLISLTPYITVHAVGMAMNCVKWMQLTCLDSFLSVLTSLKQALAYISTKVRSQGLFDGRISRILICENSKFFKFYPPDKILNA